MGLAADGFVRYLKQGGDCSIVHARVVPQDHNRTLAVRQRSHSCEKRFVPLEPQEPALFNERIGHIGHRYVPASSNQVDRLIRYRFSQVGHRVRRSPTPRYRDERILHDIFCIGMVSRQQNRKVHQRTTVLLDHARIAHQHPS